MIREVRMKQRLTYKNGGVLSYAEYGNQNGTPILVQHGLIASIDDFDLFERLIRNHARLICIARPGYDGSAPYEMACFGEWAEIVSPLIEKLNLTQFDVLAMSSGAPYGYALGWRFPGKVRNIYVFSGIPALYDEAVRADWPYPVIENQSLDELEDLAHELFFANLTDEDRLKNDIRDSTRHHGFGVAQDLKLRWADWGFRLAEVTARVFMRHSILDEAVPYQTAVIVAGLRTGAAGSRPAFFGGGVG
jgi:pimeloyl-ACP methyl ester carboxylesterase